MTGISLSELVLHNRCESQSKYKDPQITLTTNASWKKLVKKADEQEALNHLINYNKNYKKKFNSV